MTEPVTDSVDGQCVDTDGDGWGWDGQGSCLVGTSDAQVTSGDPVAPLTTLLSYTAGSGLVQLGGVIPGTVTTFRQSPSIDVGDLIGKTTQCQAIESYSRLISNNQDFRSSSFDAEPDLTFAVSFALIDFDGFSRYRLEMAGAGLHF